MKVEIKGSDLIITVALNVEGKESKSKESLVHATTGGNQPSGINMPNGKPLIIGLNAYTKK